MRGKAEVLDLLSGKLIVSCQAPPGSPLSDPGIMAAMAAGAAHAGAAGIRADSPAHIRAIRERVALPIIGIYKRRDLGLDAFITPTVEDAVAVWDAGAEIIALDATTRARPGALSAAELIGAVRDRLPGALVMADISTLDEGVAAARAGADIVATTLSGYTPYSPNLPGPDLRLVRELVRAVEVPVFCEGRIARPEEAAEALQLGAYAVVVGTAITNPVAITRRFVAAVASAPRGAHGGREGGGDPVG